MVAHTPSNMHLYLTLVTRETSVEQSVTILTALADAVANFANTRTVQLATHNSLGIRDATTPGCVTRPAARSASRVSDRFNLPAATSTLDQAISMPPKRISQERQIQRGLHEKHARVLNCLSCANPPNLASFVPQATLGPSTMGCHISCGCADCAQFCTSSSGTIWNTGTRSGEHKPR